MLHNIYLQLKFNIKPICVAVTDKPHYGGNYEDMKIGTCHKK